MTKENWIIALLLAALAINFFTWGNLKELRQELTRVQGEMGSLRSHVSSEVSGIRGTVESIRDDSRWWTPATMDILAVEKETAQLRLSWQLKEYQAGSRVALNYQVGDEEFKEVVAQESASGYFWADLTIALPNEPVWHMYLTQETGKGQVTSGKAHSVHVVNEHMEGGPGLELKYYISVVDRGTTLTSEMRNFELSKLSYHLFSTLDTQVGMQSNGEITVAIYEHQPYEPYYSINTISLESRSNNKVVEQWPVNRKTGDSRNHDPAERATIYDTRAVPAKQYDSLFIVVEYTDGMRVEKELPFQLTFR